MFSKVYLKYTVPTEGREGFTFEKPIALETDSNGILPLQD